MDGELFMLGVVLKMAQEKGPWQNCSKEAKKFHVKCFTIQGMSGHKSFGRFKMYFKAVV